MKKIIAVANQKGGVGKTTTSINVSTSIAMENRSVLMIDLDPQANATSGLGVQTTGATIYDCLATREFIQDAVISTDVAGLDIVAASSDLVGAEVELSHVDGREEVLKGVLSKVGKDYDWIILDCPPALGLLTINALVAASSVLMPVQCEYYAMEGLGRLIGNIDRIKESLNPHLEIEGIVLTMYDSRINLSRQVEKEIREYFQDKVYTTVIPRNVALAESPSYGKPALLYNATSSGSRAYMDLAKEIIE